MKLIVMLRDSHMIATALHQIGDFLEVDNAKWNMNRIARAEGNLASAGRPKAFGFYRLARRVRKWCMDHDMEGAVRTAKAIGISNATFGRLQAIPKPSRELKEEAWRSYQSEVHALEILLGRNISFWGPETWRGGRHV